MDTAIGNRLFYGAIHGIRSLPGLTLADTRYQPGAVVPPHVHEAGLFCLVLAGVLVEQNPREVRWCGPGVPTRCFTIQLDAAWTRRAGDGGLAPPAHPVDLRHTRGPWWAEQIRREVAAADPASDLVIEGLLMAVLGEMRRVVASPVEPTIPPWLKRARALLDGCLGKRLEMRRIAAEVGVHPVHLSRSFHRHVGITTRPSPCERG